MPDPNYAEAGEFIITGAAKLEPNMLISVTDKNGTKFVGRITDIRTGTARVEPVPETWIRTGQTAYRRREPSDRVQVVGITELIHLRRWITHGQTAELGVRTTVDPEDFAREWWPHYNSNQTAIGARFYRVRQHTFYEVFREERDMFMLRDPLTKHDVVLNREGEDPAEWLYVGTKPVDGKTNFHGITITRKMAVQALPPQIRTRFDRDDVL
jgi:hypothetical protein